MKEAALETMKAARRERGVRKETIAVSKETTTAWRAIEEVLSGGPATTLEIAKQSGLEPQRVFWHINAMRKYGTAAVVEQDGNYLRYGLVKPT